MQLNAKIGENERIRKFHYENLFGPIFICSCCSRKLYENAVTKITSDFRGKVDSKRKDFFSFCIKKEIQINLTFNGSNEKTGSYICSTCKEAMLQGKVPSMAEINGLKLTPIKEACNLTELENNLIAQNINFQYIFCLKKSRWAATKKQMISIPVSSDNVLNTINQLPRLPSEAGLIPIGLKRKQIYKNCHRKEYVDTNKIFAALDFLKSSGHPYYQFYDSFNDYEKRCKELDHEGYKLCFGDDDEEMLEAEKANGEFVNEYVANDTIRKHQFNHNNFTCMTKNFPEIEADDNGKITSHKELSFAPGEGGTPSNILEEKDWDIKSWPVLHPDGKFGLHYKRGSRLTDQQYFGQRILNKDLRFANSPSYKFAAAAYLENKQLSSKANISFMRGKKSTNVEGGTAYELEDAFTVFDGIRNTLKYWQKVKYDMIAKLENNGPFHLFFTLSCGDCRYDENFSSFLVDQGYIMDYSLQNDGTSMTKVMSKNGAQINKPLEDFLKEDLNESLHELIRTNVLTATRNFHHRVEAFKKEILLGKNNPMRVKYMSYRVEFQGRGAAHIHGTLWLDIENIEKKIMSELDVQEQREGLLVGAFRKLRENCPLNEDEKKLLQILLMLLLAVH